MKWFKHESNAHANPKLEKVLIKYGADGYALYWMCLEAIAAPIDKHNLTFELKHDAEILGYRLKIDSLRVEEIMSFMVSLNLFELDEATKNITCMKLAERLENSTVKNPQLREVQRLLSRTIPDNPGQSRPDKTRLDKTRTNNKPKAKKVGKNECSEFIRPEWINQSLWDDFMLIRKKLKAVNSSGALKSLVTKLERMKHSGYDPNEVIAQSIENSWKGVFELRGSKNGTHQQDNRSRSQRVSDKLDEIARRDIEKNGFTGSLD